MPDPLQDVVKGTPIGSPSARAENSIRQSARDFRQRKFGSLGEGQNANPPVAYLECLVQNITGSDLPQGSVLVQGAALVDPAVFPLDAQDQPAFEAGLVTLASGAFVVTADAIPSNGIGRAVTSGLAVVTVHISDATHTRAVPVVGVSSYMVSAASGGVPLWWTPGGTGTKVCLVLVGGTGGAVQPYGTNDAIAIAGARTTAGLITIPTGSFLICTAGYALTGGPDAILNFGVEAWDGVAIPSSARGYTDVFIPTGTVAGVTKTVPIAHAAIVTNDGTKPRVSIVFGHLAGFGGIIGVFSMVAIPVLPLITL